MKQRKIAFQRRVLIFSRLVGLTNVTLITLCACSGRVHEAEARYEIVKKSGRATDVCEAGKAVAAAYLQAQDAEGYDRRKNETEIECNAAEDKERLGIFKMADGSEQAIQPDNMESASDKARSKP